MKTVIALGGRIGGMAITAENKYGIRCVTENDVHGEIDVWLEKITEVVNLMLAVWDRDFEMLVQWDGPKRLILTAGRKDDGKAILAVLGEKASEALPKSFVELVDTISFALTSNFDLDEELCSKESLLEMAEDMREEKEQREKFLRQINQMMDLIFETEETRNGAEKRVLQRWADALAENGWVVSEEVMRNLCQIPILGKDSILIYYGSVARYPRYYRVTVGNGAGVKIERIEAIRLADVPNGNVLPLSKLATEELETIASIIFKIASEVGAD